MDGTRNKLQQIGKEDSLTGTPPTAVTSVAAAVPIGGGL